MKSSCSQSRRRAMRLAFGLQAALMASNLVVTPVLFAADLSQSEHQHQATPVSNPSWAEALKGQTRVEDANGMSMMHQYMGQDGSSFLLMSDNKAEPVSMSGGKCPATAPTKHYDIAMINVEITLNRWLDFYPGYMYVLTENIEKVRAEEAKNKAARDKEMDPGAVSTGLQGDWIQPLVIRGNQGDCVKITLRNQMESEAGICILESKKESGNFTPTATTAS